MLTTFLYHCCRSIFYDMSLTHTVMFLMCFLQTEIKHFIIKYFRLLNLRVAMPGCENVTIMAMKERLSMPNVDFYFRH